MIIHRYLKRLDTVTKEVECCIYCGSTRRLSIEHVIAYSINGHIALKNGSCETCANITKKFEDRVLGKAWGAARTYLKSRSRKKTNRHEIVLRKLDDGTEVYLPIEFSMPALAFYVSEHHAEYLSVVEVPQDATVSAKFIVLHVEPGKGTNTVHTTNMADSTSHFRLVCKICHGLVCYFLEDEEFLPLAVEFILGRTAEYGKVIGVPIEGIVPKRVVIEEDGIHYYKIFIVDDLVVVNFKYFSHLDTPMYQVVVGRLSRPDPCGLCVRR